MHSNFPYANPSQSPPGAGYGGYSATHDHASSPEGPHSRRLPPNPQMTPHGHYPLPRQQPSQPYGPGPYSPTHLPQGVAESYATAQLSPRRPQGPHGPPSNPGALPHGYQPTHPNMSTPQVSTYSDHDPTLYYYPSRQHPLPAHHAPLHYQDADQTLTRTHTTGYPANDSTSPRHSEDRPYANGPKSAGPMYPPPTDLYTLSPPVQPTAPPVPLQATESQLTRQLHDISLELDSYPTAALETRVGPANHQARLPPSWTSDHPLPAPTVAASSNHLAMPNTAYRSQSTRQPSAGTNHHAPVTRRATDSSVAQPPGFQANSHASEMPRSAATKQLPSRASTSASVSTTLPPRSSHRPSVSSQKATERSHSVSSARSLPPHMASSLARRTIPAVYPALVSRVANAFRYLIQPRTHIKDSLEYPECFTGSEAVDVISAIIHTTDRNLALLVGRSLDSQKFFHDVTYEHRLRDHPDELYVFQELTYSPYSQVEDDEITLRSAQSEPQSPTLSLTTSGLALPTGVFTQLTDCYSPTCSTDQICYSATCPRRLEQRARMRMSANEGVAQALSASISEDRKEERLWSKTVPKHIVDSVTKKELKRQEMIFELVYTEKDYVRDLELLNEIYLKPLQHRDIIPEDKRHKFIFAIFFNLPTVLTVNLGFRDALNRRQGESYIVDQIGDIVKYHATKFTPYVRYGAHQVLARHFLDMERSRNPEFDRFLDEQERHPEARKLSVHSFLNRPTTRLGRYPLLLRGIRDATAEGHPDRENLDKAMDAIKTLLSQINVETGKASNRVRLSKLKDQLQCKPSDTNDLNLLEEGRQIVQEGPLKKRSSVETTEVTCFLLDHMFLMARKKKGKENGMQGYKIIKRPIPLELLTVTIPDEQSAETPTPNAANANSPGGVSGLKSGGLVGLARPLGRSNAMFSSTTHLPSPQLQRPGGDNLMSAKLGYPIILTHLGRRGGTQTFYASSYAERREWVDNILKQRDIKTKQNMKFALSPLTDLTFPLNNKVNTSVTFDHNRRVAFGTDQGIYVGLNNNPSSFEKLPLTHERVTQIDILEEYNIFFVLSDKDRNLYAYTLEALNPTLATGARPRKVHSHVTFFKAGACLNRVLVCSVRSSQITTIIKSDEPISPNHVRRNKSFGRFLPRGSHEILRPYKEFYIPSETTSLHIFKTLLIVGCLKGFEFVDPVSSKTQELLDPKDESLNFVRKRENVRPIAIYKVQDGDFLLCYDELAFYVNKNGQRARSHWIIHWEGEPTSFALCYPYILAFNPSFIEIRHVETGQLEQVIITGNSASLSTDPSSIHCVMAPSLTEPQRLYKLTRVTSK